MREEHIELIVSGKCELYETINRLIVEPLKAENARLKSQIEALSI